MIHLVTHTMQRKKGWYQTRQHPKQLTPDGVICCLTDLKFVEQMQLGIHQAVLTYTPVLVKIHFAIAWLVKENKCLQSFPTA